MIFRILSALFPGLVRVSVASTRLTWPSYVCGSVVVDMLGCRTTSSRKFSGNFGGGIISSEPISVVVVVVLGALYSDELEVKFPSSFCSIQIPPVTLLSDVGEGGLGGDLWWKREGDLAALFFGALGGSEGRGMLGSSWSSEN